MEQQPAGFIGEIMSYKVHLNRTLIDIARIYIFSPLDWPTWVLINMYQGRVLSPLFNHCCSLSRGGEGTAACFTEESRLKNDSSPPDAASGTPTHKHRGEVGR